MNIKRVWQHLKPNPFRRHFDADAQAQLTQIISQAELGHRGEIRLVVEAKLRPSLLWRGVTPRERAITWFSDLRVWDTEGNTGILLYLLLAENKLELVADRGIAGKVPQAEWDALCQQLQRDLAENRVVAGLSHTLSQLGALLAQHFPMGEHSDNPNELSNTPVIIV